MQKILLCFLLLPLCVTAQFEDYYTEDFAARHAREEKLKADMRAFVGLIKIINGSYGYEEVVQVPSANARELYNRARIWMAGAFVNSNYVIRFDDKDSNRIIVKSNLTYSFTKDEISYNNDRLEFLLEIIAKDDRYMFRFYNLDLYKVATGSSFPSKRIDLRKHITIIKAGGKESNRRHRFYRFAALSKHFFKTVDHLKAGMNRPASGDF